MDKDSPDAIVIAALLERFTKRRLPRALDIEERVLAGEKLNGSDLTFLENVIRDAKYILRYTDKYQEYQELATEAVQLYKEITQKALENEKKS